MSVTFKIPLHKGFSVVLPDPAKYLKGDNKLFICAWP